MDGSTDVHLAKNPTSIPTLKGDHVTTFGAFFPPLLGPSFSPLFAVFFDIEATNTTSAH